MMTENQELIQPIFKGWQDYQQILTQVLSLLTAEQLKLRAAPNLRSVGGIAAHMIGARARWFYMGFGEGGEEFETLGKIDRRSAKPRSAPELVNGLQTTWTGMHEAIARWTPEEWQQPWPGEDDSEPGGITAHWVVWHLIEHDLHHGGEISITLGAHGVPALDL